MFVECEGTELRENVSVEDDHRVDTINISVKRRPIRLERKNGEVRWSCKASPFPFILTNISLSLSPPHKIYIYRSADKSLARPTSRCILFDGENNSFDASLVIYI